MRILVTGATGFIGAHLVEVLSQRGYEVRCFVRPLSSPSFPKDKHIELVYGDIVDPSSLESAVKEANYVFHLAAVHTVCHSYEEFVRVNVQGTRNLLEACYRVAPNIKRFVHISSISAVGPRGSYEVLREDSPCMPRNSYGESKLLSEKFALEYSKKIPVTIVRPPMVYGPRDRNPSTVFKYMKMVRKGFYLSRGSYRNYFSCIYVKDLVDGLIVVLESDPANCQTYFMCSDMPTTFDEICELSAKVLNKNVLKITIPSFVLKGKAFLKNLSAKHSKIPNLDKPLVEYWICDSTKAKSELGFQAKTSLAEGIEQTVKWYQQQGWI